MTRATIFRIVGIAFLGFAAVSTYLGEFQIEGSGGVIITRAHDPEGFWLFVVMQIGVGCALLYLSRVASKAPFSSSAPSRPGDRGGSFSSPQPAEEFPKLFNYDPVFCGKVIKGGACVCVGLIVAELLVLLLVHPSDDRCPGWIFHPRQPSAVSLWVLAGMFTVLPALWICNVALRWDTYYARKMYDDGEVANWLMMIVVVGWCLFCAIPLFLMLGECTALSRYLNLNAFHF